MTGAVKDTVARLKKLVSAVEKIGAEAVIASAGRCAAAARESVPVDTGELRDSIGAASGGEYVSSVFASAPHAAMVEYGTVKMSPQPFMLPAALIEAESFFADAKSELKRAAKEI